MALLINRPELVGFFSYSREDDADSHGALSALRNRVQGELRGLLGRTAKTFRLWQDKEAIAAGKFWASEIKLAVAQSSFFIPIITPTVVASSHCRFELESFLAREAELGRDDLVFPILYIDVPALEDTMRQQNDQVLSLIAQRQYADWREFRHLDSNSTEVKRAVERYCRHIRDALNKPWVSPEECKQKKEAAAQLQTEMENQLIEAEAKRHANAQQRAVVEERRKCKTEQYRKEETEERWRNAEEVQRRHQAAAKSTTEAERHPVENERLQQEVEANRQAPLMRNIKITSTLAKMGLSAVTTLQQMNVWVETFFVFAAMVILTKVAFIPFRLYSHSSMALSLLVASVFTSAICFVLALICKRRYSLSFMDCILIAIGYGIGGMIGGGFEHFIELMTKYYVFSVDEAIYISNGELRLFFGCIGVVAPFIVRNKMSPRIVFTVSAIVGFGLLSRYVAFGLFWRDSGSYLTWAYLVCPVFLIGMLFATKRTVGTVSFDLVCIAVTWFLIFCAVIYLARPISAAINLAVNVSSYSISEDYESDIIYSILVAMFILPTTMSWLAFRIARPSAIDAKFT
jgi:VIT1/CCC1 family predicted Fe2+/Mn2+ transporter